jgi:plasmid stabilization system protein ParE
MIFLRSGTNSNQQGSTTIADKVEAAILDKIKLLTNHPEIGHFRSDLADRTVKFFPIYSYLIGYKPESTPVQVISILHFTGAGT